MEKEGNNIPKEKGGFFKKLGGFFKKHKALTIILVIVLVLAIVVVYMGNKAEKTLGSIKEDTATVEYRDLTSTVSATGKIKSVDKKDVTSTTMSVEVLQMNVEVGDFVNEGDLICVLDSSKLESNLEDATAQLNVSKANTGISINSATRTLQDAEVTRNVDAERANQDIAQAWDDYCKAATTYKEASDKYSQASQARQGAENALKSAQANSTAGGLYSNAKEQFDKMKGEFETYLGSDDMSGCVGMISGLSIDNISTCVLRATSYADNDAAAAAGSTDGKSDFLKSDGSAPSDPAKINTYISNLKTIANQYSVEYATASSQVSAAQASLTAAQANETAAKATFESAQATADARLQTYYKQIQTYEDTARRDNNTVESSKDSLNTTKNSASVSTLSTEAQIEDYQSQIDGCKVYAPISGTVTAVNYKVGDKFTGATALVTIEDESNYQVSAQIEEYDIGKIELGQKVIIVTNGTGDEKLEGVVSKIAPHATSSVGTTTSSSVTYEVTIDVLTPNPSLKMDMTAKINIVVEDREHILTVQYDAVQTDEDGNFFVEVVTEDAEVLTDGKNAKKGPEEPVVYEKIIVTKGISSDFYVEIKGDGLTDGMVVRVPVDLSTETYSLGWEIG